MKVSTILFTLIATLSLSHGQGTIAFGNSALTKYSVGRSATLQDPAMNFGVFVNGSSVPVQPLGFSSTTTAGIIVAGGVYAIPGTEPGQVVRMQIRGWSASFGTDWQTARAFGIYLESDVREITLGPTAGPGTVIWQTATGTNPNRFYPLSIPEPMTVSLLALAFGSFTLFRRYRGKVV